MRLAHLVVVFALTLSAAASAATFVERQPVQEVELADLLEHPQTYVNVHVKFRCVFIANGDLYDPFHTRFTDNNFINLVVWDDDTKLWDPAVRAEPVITIFFDKVRAGHSCWNKLRKFQTVDIVAEVSSAFRDKPWINIFTMDMVGGGEYSDNGIYHLEQAIALSVDGTRDIANEHFDAVLKEDLPATAAVHVRQLKAINLIHAGAFDDAEGTLKRAIDFADGQPAKVRANLYYLLAKTQSELAERAHSESERKSRFEEAVASANTSLELDPTQGDTYAVVGISLAGLGRYDDARRQCSQAIRMQPNNAEVRWYLGRIYDLQGQYDEAIEALKKAIDITPKDSRLHKAIAAAYAHRSQKGGASHGTDLSTALKEYDIAIRLNPNDADTYYEDAVLLEAAAEEKLEVTGGDGKKTVITKAMAMDRYQGALNLDNKNLNAHLALAKYYQSENKPEEANKHLQAVFDLDPKQIKRYIEVGDYLVSAGRPDDALATYQRGLKIDGKNAELLWRMGHTARDLGKEKEAIDWLEKALRSDDDHVKANLDLAEIYLANGRPKDAARKAGVALDKAKTDEDKVRAQAVIDASQTKRKEKKKEADPAQVEPGPVP